MSSGALEVEQLACIMEIFGALSSVHQSSISKREVLRRCFESITDASNTSFCSAKP